MWIRYIEPADAEGALRRLYEQVQTADGHVDAILKAHSLRPRTLRGHLALYKAVLHDPGIGLSPRERELVGVCVSMANGCDYCVEHHRAGLARHLGDADLARELAEACMGTRASDAPTARERSLCAYALKLTRTPAEMVASDLDALRGAGLSDGEILDLDQIVSYFAYANRTVLGLGVTIDGEPLGLHPDERSEGLTHG